MPSGRVIEAGSGTIVGGFVMRMTISPIITTTPTIIVPVKTVTSLRKNFRLAGSSGSSFVTGASFMAETSSLTVVISADPFPRLDKALSRDVPEDANLSRSRLAKLIAAGQVVLNGVVEVNQKAKVQEGDVVEITVPVASESYI